MGDQIPEAIENNPQNNPPGYADHLALMELNDHTFWTLRSRGLKLDEDIRASIKEIGRLKLILREKEKLVDELRAKIESKKFQKSVLVAERNQVEDALKALDMKN